MGMAEGTGGRGKGVDREPHDLVPYPLRRSCTLLALWGKSERQWKSHSFFYWSRVVQAFAQLKRAMSTTKSGNTMFSKAVLKKWCTKAYLKSFLRKPLLKSYNYLQNCHRFPYYIGLYLTNVKPTTTTTTTPYPTRWGRLHGSTSAIMFYQVPYFYPNH